MNKPLTIKEVSPENIEYFHSLKQGGLNQNQAFAKLIDQAKNSNPNTEVFEGEIQNLKAEIEKKTTDCEILQEEVLQFQSAIEGFQGEIETLKTEIENLKEAAKSNELTGMQFICNPSETTFEKCRKARSFIRKRGDFDFSNEDYPERLAEHAINFYLDSEFSNIVNK